MFADLNVSIYDNFFSTTFDANVVGDPSLPGYKSNFSFRAIRRGDLNNDNCGYCFNSCAPQSLKQNIIQDTYVDSRNIQIDFSIEKPLSVNGFEIFLEPFSTEDFEIKEVRSDITSFSRKNYRINDINSTLIDLRSSWNSANPLLLTSEQSFLSLDVVLKDEATTSSLKKALKDAIVNLYDVEGILGEDIKITLQNKNHRSSGTISVYPNPFQDLLNIEFERTEMTAGKAELLDVRGRRMWSEDYIAEKGKNKLTIRTVDLPEGMYFLRQTEKGGIVSVEKIVK